MATLGFSRRQFLARAAMLLATAAIPSRLAANRPLPEEKTRLILLGTAGGPRPHKNSFPPSQVILINGAAYVIDCGNGVALQLARAGVPLPSLRHVFITHHHSDHNADYGNLLLLAWASGLHTRVDTWGPPPLVRMTRLFFEMDAYDISTRIADEGRVPLSPLIHAHELTREATVMDDGNVSVRCTVVDHPPVQPSFAYRFDSHDRSIVISGDTRPSDALIRLAQGADVLVHEALFPPAVERMVARLPNAAKLEQSIVHHHTVVEDAGRVASAAGVKLLVLSHLVPADDPEVSDQMWLDAARSTFGGDIIVGRDLLAI